MSGHVWTCLVKTCLGFTGLTVQILRRWCVCVGEVLLWGIVPRLIRGWCMGSNPHRNCRDLHENSRPTLNESMNDDECNIQKTNLNKKDFKCSTVGIAWVCWNVHQEESQKPRWVEMSRGVPNRFFQVSWDSPHAACCSGANPKAISVMARGCVSSNAASMAASARTCQTGT